MCRTELKADGFIPVYHTRLAVETGRQGGQRGTESVSVMFGLT